MKRIITTLKSYNYRTLNFRLIIYTLALSIIGINVINSASDDSTQPMKQLIGLIIGFVVMILLALVKYEYIARYYWLAYILSIILLSAVLIMGVTRSGAQRWIMIGGDNGIQVQPSEICKILLIIFFAAYFDKHKQQINTFRFLMSAVVLFAIPLILIFMEPDLSTSIVIFIIFCAIIISSEISGKVLLKITAVVLPVLAGIVALVLILPADQNIISEYQYNRIIGFYDEDNEVAADIRYQQENSVMAIASGGLTGKGLNNNSITSVKNADYVSEPETDFIFTIVGEELGFVGSAAVVLLYALLVFECFRTGYRAREGIGRSIAVGMGVMFGIQAFFNIGVATMIIPNTGLTLPFLSYGLSSLITCYIGIGLVLNIGLQKRITF